MQLPGLLELIVAFVLGVVSSITASIIIFLFKANTIIDRAIRLRNLQRNFTLDSDDPHALVRAEWAYALRDLGSKNKDHALKAIQSLSYMADLLDKEERDIAYEALRLRCATDQFRNADPLYLNAMHRLRE